MGNSRRPVPGVSHRNVIVRLNSMEMVWQAATTQHGFDRLADLGTKSLDS